ncbi:hypothetical protein ACFLYR_07405 [Chloroflexota bacterium]
MKKEPYVKPEVTSEMLDPGALGDAGSPTGGDKCWLQFFSNPSCGFCCEAEQR